MGYPDSFDTWVKERVNKRLLGGDVERAIKSYIGTRPGIMSAGLNPTTHCNPPVARVFALESIQKSLADPYLNECFPQLVRTLRDEALPQGIIS